MSERKDGRGWVYQGRQVEIHPFAQMASCFPTVPFNFGKAAFVRQANSYPRINLTVREDFIPTPKLKPVMKCNFFPVCILSLTGLVAACQQAPTKVNEPRGVRTGAAAVASKLLALEDAEKIMGEQAELTGNTFLKKGDTLEYKCDYTALSQDATTSKTGKLYFMYEVYGGAAAAANAYAAIYRANSGHDGVEAVSGLGNEAYYHSDQTGFYFFLVRKKAKLFRLKLNKVTSHSSVTEFKKATKRLVGKL